MLSLKKIGNQVIETGRKVWAATGNVALCCLLALSALMAQGVDAQTTPTIYDPGVNISGMTTVAADGLGDVVITALAVAFGFLVIALGFGWVKKYMRSK